MDLIYANAERLDIGVLKKYSLDCEISTKADDNTFYVELFADKEVYDNAFYIYCEGEEYGGIVDKRKVSTGQKKLTLSGRTWRGILASKIVEPDAGEAYLTVTGSVSAILQQMIERYSLTELFEVDGDIQAQTTYKFERYTDLYSGLAKMLRKIGYRMTTVYYGGMCHLSAVPVSDYTGLAELTSDMFDFDIETTQHTANHMIGLGSGQLAERTVIHKYVQEDGSVGDTQFYFGLDEVVEVYDNSNSENDDDLEERTAEQLESKSVKDGVNITSKDLSAEVGDIFQAYDVFTGIRAKQQITKKIVKINNGNISINYEIGAIK